MLKLLANGEPTDCSSGWHARTNETRHQVQGDALRTMALTTAVLTRPLHRGASHDLDSKSGLGSHGNRYSTQRQVVLRWRINPRDSKQLLGISSADQCSVFQDSSALNLSEEAWRKSLFDEDHQRRKAPDPGMTMKPLKAPWPLSDGAPSTVLHLEATPSTRDLRGMTSIVELQR